MPSAAQRSCCACPDVNKVDFIADQEQRIYVEIANAQLAKLGLTPQQIADAVDAQNAVAACRHLHHRRRSRVRAPERAVPGRRGRLANTLIRVNGRTFRLGDIATISPRLHRSADQYMRFERQNVLGIGVTMAPPAM